MKLPKLLGLALGLASLATVANAAVFYLGNTTSPDLTSEIDLSVDPTATLGGSYDAATRTWTWAASDTYILEELIFVRNGTLAIEAGSIVRAQPRTSAAVFDGGALIISRGAKIIAEGAADNPIVFTTASITGNDTVYGGRQSTGNQTPTFWDNNPVGAPKPNVKAGLWGGLVVLGNAPTNVDRDNITANGVDVATAEQVFFDINGSSALSKSGNTTISTFTVSTDDRSSVEGIPTPSAANNAGWDRFGGHVATENSGTLRYVSIRHGGSNLATAAELNGLTLGGVGSGTTIDYVEIWGNTDDGVEIFGGTVNLSHIAIFNPGDDGLDLDSGYTGTVQFLVVVAGNLTDRLCEWDGSYEAETVNGFTGTGPVTANYLPVANALIANGTFVGNTAVTTAIGSISGSRNDHSFNIRDQSAYRLLNSVVVNARGAGYEIDNRSTNVARRTTSRFSQGLAWIRGVTSFTTVANLDGTSGNSTAAAWLNRGSDDATMRTLFTTNALNWANTYGVNPGLNISALDTNVSNGILLNLVPTNPQGFFLEDSVTNSNSNLSAANYAGAFEPDPSASSWLNGWSAARAANVVRPNGF